ncbi:MAG: hypothetical protein JXB42_12745 [Deltaproteobacteria bacterium]|nr:hypothetical protein [Deltaproteobacteria bacterium]
MNNQPRTVKKNLLFALIAFHEHDLTYVGQKLDPAIGKCYLSQLITEYATRGSTHNPRVRRQISELYDVSEDILFPEYDPATDVLPVIEENRNNFLRKNGGKNESKTGTSDVRGSSRPGAYAGGGSHGVQPR